MSIPVGVKVRCKLSASPSIDHILTATLKKYCRVHGMQTVKDNKDPNPDKNKFYPVKLVEVEVPGENGQPPFKVRIDKECIVGVAHSRKSKESGGFS